jgi:hypothetical protein
VHCLQLSLLHWQSFSHPRSPLQFHTQIDMSKMHLLQVGFDVVTASSRVSTLWQAIGIDGQCLQLSMLHLQSASQTLSPQQYCSHIEILLRQTVQGSIGGEDSSRAEALGHFVLNHGHCGQFPRPHSHRASQSGSPSQCHSQRVMSIMHLLQTIKSRAVISSEVALSRDGGHWTLGALHWEQVSRHLHDNLQSLSPLHCARQRLSFARGVECW